VTRPEAEAIRYCLQSPGWLHIQKMIDDEIQTNRDELSELMAKNPDKLTGKTAIKYAVRARALEDLKEEIFGSQKLLAPQPGRAGS